LGTAGQSVRGISHVPSGALQILSQAVSEAENASAMSFVAALYAICPNYPNPLT